MVPRLARELAGAEDQKAAPRRRRRCRPRLAAAAPEAGGAGRGRRADATRRNRLTAAKLRGSAVRAYKGKYDYCVWSANHINLCAQVRREGRGGRDREREREFISGLAREISWCCALRAVWSARFVNPIRRRLSAAPSVRHPRCAFSRLIAAATAR